MDRTIGTRTSTDCDDHSAHIRSDRLSCRQPRSVMSFLLPAALAKHFSAGNGNKATDTQKRTAAGGPVKASSASRNTAPTAARLFTAEEVAAHATESDCYTVVEGKSVEIEDGHMQHGAVPQAHLLTIAPFACVAPLDLSVRAECTT